MALKEAREALQKVAEGEDKEEAKKAKQALAAMDEEHKEPDGDECESDDEEKDKAEGEPDGDEKKDDEKKDEAKAEGEVDVLALAKDLHSLKVDLQRKAESEQRDKLLASRPDFDEKVIATLKKLPVAKVKEAVETWPRAAGGRGQVSAARAALNTTGGVRGEGQQGGGDHLPPDEARALSVRMGLEKGTAIRTEGNSLVLGVMSRDEAKAYQASQKGNV